MCGFSQRPGGGGAKQVRQIPLTPTAFWEAGSGSFLSLKRAGSDFLHFWPLNKFWTILNVVKLLSEANLTPVESSDFKTLADVYSSLTIG